MRSLYGITLQWLNEVEGEDLESEQYIAEELYMNQFAIRRYLMQKKSDIAYRHQLSNVLSSFSMEVNNYSYRSMISSVSSVAAMSELTSYEEINDNLDLSLNHLYISLREEKSKDKILSRIEELREIFNIMLQDPANNKATDSLLQIANETFFYVEE